MENGGRIAAAALATVVVGCGSTVALIRQRSDRARPETVNDMIPHSSIDVALAPVVLELATCDAARALLLRVAEAQHMRHGRPLRVRCQPDSSSSSSYQSDAVWQPAASTIRVNCHNAQPTKVGSLLFELLNANEEEQPDGYAAIRRRRDAGELRSREEYARAMEAVEYKVMQRHHAIAAPCWPGPPLDPACCPRCPPACSRRVDSYRCCLECGPCRQFETYLRMASTPAEGAHADDCHAGAYRRQWDHSCGGGLRSRKFRRHPPPPSPTEPT